MSDFAAPGQEETQCGDTGSTDVITMATGIIVAGFTGIIVAGRTAPSCGDNQLTGILMSD